MTIIELCGTPGCGKSTTLKAFKKKYPDLAAKLLDYKSIYPPTAMLRGFSKRLNMFRVKLFGMLPFVLSKEEKTIYSFMRENDDKNCLYIAKTIGIYKGLKNNFSSSKTLVLDEGIIQHLSSGAYERSLTGIKSLVPVFESLQNVNYVCIRFSCDEENVVKRIAGRHNGKRYDIADKKRLLQLLYIKNTNIDQLIEMSCFKVRSLDTQKSPEENAEAIAEIIKEIIK